ncbi:hypothetical protein [Vibrio sp. St2]|uniref:hypothetical protein n=1 Tax=Vibrio sp. St2 TaxID=2853441 RepID=UPI00248E3C91|nr:hypothetical protein [Vibrio sp. St2]
MDIAVLSLILASMGLIVSLLTFYFTHLKRHQVNVVAGPFTKIYHADYDDKYATGLYLPMTFFNTSSGAGVVDKTALEVFSIANPDKRFFIQGKSFSELDVGKNQWKNKEIAHAIPVLGKSSVHKTIQYYWTSLNEDRLCFVEGSYILELVYWIVGDPNPHKRTYELTIDKHTEAKLAGFRERRKSTTVDVMMNKELAFNRILSKYESATMLGASIPNKLLKSDG